MRLAQFYTTPSYTVVLNKWNYHNYYKIKITLFGKYYENFIEYKNNNN